MKLLEKIFGSKNQKIIKKIQPLVDKINALEESFSQLNDLDLKSKRSLFIKRYKDGETLDDLLPEAFATVREVSKRQLKLRPYDCQLIGGIALHNCRIAEMATGEGKTLVATLPCYLNSITERTVVLVTVNDYLAKRDSAWMGKVFNYLGVSTGCITNDLEDIEVKDAEEIKTQDEFMKNLDKIEKVKDWEAAEKRMEIIGQNGNDGEHYSEEQSQANKDRIKKIDKTLSETPKLSREWVKRLTTERRGLDNDETTKTY